MSDREDAQSGLKLIADAIVHHLKVVGEQRNGDIARALGLETHHEEKQKNYLTYSVLGMLIAEGKVRKTKVDNHTTYVAT